MTADATRVVNVISACAAPGAFGATAPTTLFRAAGCDAAASIFGRGNKPVFSVTGPGTITAGTCNR
jgi:hypothetical protein